MATVEQIRAGIANDAVQTFGQVAQPMQNEHPPMRVNVLTFARGSFRVSLDLSAFWDRNTNSYGEYTANLSVSNNRKYSSIPVDPEVITDLAEWLTGVANIAKDAPVRSTDRTDKNFEEAKKTLAKYKKV